jgi:uncharacterized protein
MMNESAAFNSRVTLFEHKGAGRLTWAGPAIMLLARSVLAVFAQGMVAAIYAALGSTAPWRDAAAWLPVYGTLIDLGCLALLWRLTRREGITLIDLTGFDRRRLGRDLLFGLALIPPSLLLIFGGNSLASLIVFDDPAPPQIFSPLPLLPAFYAVLVFPLVWGVVEQTTYNGYVLPRLQLLSGNTPLAVALVAMFWSFQHCVLPLTFDFDFMLYRMLSPLLFSTFIALVYLRIRRIVPLATAHWLMDGASAFISTLLPLLR